MKRGGVPVFLQTELEEGGDGTCQARPGLLDGGGDAVLFWGALLWGEYGPLHLMLTYGGKGEGEGWE